MLVEKIKLINYFLIIHLRQVDLIIYQCPREGHLTIKAFNNSIMLVYQSVMAKNPCFLRWSYDNT